MARLLGHDEVFFAAHDGGLADDVAFAHVLQKVRPLGGVSEASVGAVQQVLAGRGQVRVEEQPKPLRRRTSEKGGTRVGEVKGGGKRSTSGDAL